ncbi:MAG: hypothetical protein GX437_07130 [Sphingobacteriales bacterium]|nr:hypothetical protein [Sphingobacteriales bacterium]
MKPLYLLAILSLFATGVSAQLTGTKTIKTSGGNYSSIASAISDLNSNGVGSGGVTFEIDANFVETASNLTISTATSSSSSPIVFKKVGSGSNPIIYATPGSSTTTDGIIKIEGTDYITFDGIDVADTSTSTNNTTLMEWGYAILKYSGTDGSQYVTIKNCNVSLKNSNVNTIGIYSGNHTSTSTSSLTVTTSSGTNSYLKIYNNKITGAYVSISIKGYSASSPYSLYDQNNEIGVDGGNVLLNYGGGSSTAYGIYAIYQNNLKIANNNISNGTIGTTTTLYGIFLSTGTSSNVEIYKNTVSLYISSSSSSTYGINNAMGSTAANNTVKIYNNTVKNITAISTYTGSFYGIYNSASADKVFIEKNLIDSVNIPGSGSLYCIYTSATYLKLYLDSNIVRNVTKTGTGTTYGIDQYNTATNGYEYIYGNTVYNISNTSTGNIYGIYSYPVSSTNKEIFSNTVYGLTTLGTTIYGISTASGDSIYLYKNKIYNLTSMNANATVYGIYMSSGTNGWIYNNFVSDLEAPSSSGANSVNGIYFNGGTNAGVYFNTVYLKAMGTSSTFGSNALYTSTSVNIDVRNNILVNLSMTGSSGVNAAYKRSTTTQTTHSSSSNNNLLYAGTPSGNNVIFYDGTNKDSTLAQFKNRFNPAESNSISENPPFVNVSSKPYDLHIKTNVATQIESGAAPVSSPVAITDDIDGNSRNTNTPDIGADEGSFTGADLSAPNISYSPLSNTSSTSSRVLKTKITDASGVPTSGSGLPRLYYRVNSGSWTTATASYNGNDSFSFTLSPTVSSGDTVKYYIVAQDNASTPNVGSKPAGASGFSANPPAASVPPASPDQYLILGSMCGTYNVGTGNTYTTITNAVNALKINEITCPVTFLLTDTLYTNETFPIKFEEYAGLSYARRVTLKPASGKNVVIKADTAVFLFNGADYITIDGSNNNSTSRNLTLKSTKTSGSNTVVGLNSLSTTNGATYITIKNCNIENGFQTAISYGIYFGGNLGSSGYGHHNLTIHNNHIYNAYYGIDGYGNSANPFDSLVITNNTIGNDSTSISVLYKGIYISYCNSPYISGNTIYNFLTTNSINIAGIDIGAGCSGAKVENNHVYNLNSLSTGGWGAYGIVISSTTSNNNMTIQNNLIHDLITDGDGTSTTYNPYGIRLAGGTNVKVYFNTVIMRGAIANTSTADQCAAFITTTSSVTGLDLRNNIFYNSMTGGSGTKAYSAYIYSSANVQTINNNDYWADGSNAVFGYYGSAMSTFSDWKTATGQDTASYNVNPLFKAQNNFEPQNGFLNNTAKDLSITTDFFGNTRSTTPDIGAIEFCPKPMTSTLTASQITSNAAKITGMVNPNNENTTIKFYYGPSIAYTTSVNATPSSLAGVQDSIVYANLTGLSPNGKYYYTISAQSACGTSTGADSSFFTLAKLSDVYTGKVDSISGSSAKVFGSVNPNNSTATIEFEYGTSTSYGSKMDANPKYAYSDTLTNVSAKLSGLMPNQKYYYRISATNQAGTVKGADSSFTTLAVKPSAQTDAASNISAYQATLNGTVNAENSQTVVYFEYGQTQAYGNIDTATQSPLNGTNPQAVSFNLSNLLPNTTYHYRVVAVNQAGISYGLDTHFVTSSLLPVVSTMSATNIQAYSADLRGKVNPNNVSTTVYFEYGLTTNYGGTLSVPQSPVNGLNDIIVSENLPNLQPNTTYHYRLVGNNQLGTVYGNDVQFTTTALPPEALTQSATGISDSEATINALVTAYNSGTKVKFEYGATSAYGTTVDAQPDSVFGMNQTAVSYQIKGLLPNSTIHYRVVAENQAGISYGADSVFNTPSILPEAVTQSADNVQTTSAELHALVKANNSPTSVVFEYGKTITYGNTITPAPDSVFGMNWENINITITGLDMNTTYHFRVVASNQAGTVYGADQSFTTDFKDVPYAKTLAASNIDVNSAQLNAEVNPNNLPTKITFEWGTTTAYGNSVNSVPDSLNGMTTSNVIYSLTGLQPNTTYHYRVKAENSLGTTYGNDTFFTTDIDYPAVTTSPVTNIGDYEATCGGDVTYEGGASVTQRGVVWSTSPNPDFTLSTKTSDGSGSGVFVSQITGLSPKTTYYVRAYATNAKGTVYGAELSFTTTNISVAENNDLKMNYFISGKTLYLTDLSGEIISIQLYDLNGKQLLNTSFTGEYTVDLSAYSSSFYILRAVSGEKTLVRQIFTK